LSRDTYSPALRSLLFALVTLAVLALALAVGTSRASADPTFTISGTISDTSGSGVSGLGLTLLDSGSNTVGLGSTNPDGTYSFPGLAPDTYTLVTSAGGGYASISSSIPVASDDVVVNLTDPRHARVSGAVTASGNPVAGLTVVAIDLVSGTLYSADAPTDSSGGYSVTLPSTSDGVEFLFTNSSGIKRAIASYSFGGGSVSPSSPCGLNADATGRAAINAGGSVQLTVALNPDPLACNTAAPTPASQQSHPASKSGKAALAITGTAVPAPTTSPTSADTTSGSTTTESAGASTEPKPQISRTSSTAPMAWWGWLLVLLAVLAMLGGVGFTVVRHR
jgi:hypothetical protein